MRKSWLVSAMSWSNAAVLLKALTAVLTNLLLRPLAMALLTFSKASWLAGSKVDLVSLLRRKTSTASLVCLGICNKRLPPCLDLLAHLTIHSLTADPKAAGLGL